jgi:predicted phosphodiesterase
MKTLIIPDIHGKTIWRPIIAEEKPDRVIFLGDYFDAYEKISPAEQIFNYKQIVELKEKGEIEVIMLIGNHDHHYFPEIGYTGTSGYQGMGKYDLEYAINETRQHLQMAYQMDQYLFTHAGVSQLFMDQIYGINGWNVDAVAENLNELFKYKLHAFTFNGRNGYGDDPEQTPIWIRPRSLMKANKKSKLNEKYIQIVGHTKVYKIDKLVAANNKYYFVDTFDSSNEYLTINNGHVKINKYDKG